MGTWKGAQRTQGLDALHKRKGHGPNYPQLDLGECIISDTTWRPSSAVQKRDKITVDPAASTTASRATSGSGLPHISLSLNVK